MQYICILYASNMQNKCSEATPEIIVLLWKYAENMQHIWCCNNMHLYAIKNFICSIYAEICTRAPYFADVISPCGTLGQRHGSLRLVLTIESGSLAASDCRARPAGRARGLPVISWTSDFTVRSCQIPGTLFLPAAATGLRSRVTVRRIGEFTD